MTTTSLMQLAVLASALGCGLMAGFFFAFSTCVMRALGAIPSAHGISAMQSINVAVINPWFLASLFGTALLSLLLGVAAVMRWQEPGAAYLMAGGLLYFVGTFLVTILFNVPRNNALAAVEDASREGATLWADYLITWTKWNHVRTVAAMTAAASFTLALTQ